MIGGKSITLDDDRLDEARSAPLSAAAYGSTGTDFLDRLREGDAKAFDNLVLRYTSDIYGLLVRLTGDLDEAADLTQETFIAALRSIRGFRGDAELRTWLFRIAINRSRNRSRWWRRRRRESTVSIDASIGDTPITIADTLEDGRESPENAVLRLEREKRLRKALAELAPAFREAVVLRDIEGLSYEQIAQAVDANLGTVRSRIARGREELRRKLQDF